MTQAATFKELAAGRGWSPDEAIEILLAYIEDCVAANLSRSLEDFTRDVIRAEDAQDFARPNEAPTEIELTDLTACADWVNGQLVFKLGEELYTWLHEYLLQTEPCDDAAQFAYKATLGDHQLFLVCCGSPLGPYLDIYFEGGNASQSAKPVRDIAQPVSLKDMRDNTLVINFSA